MLVRLWVVLSALWALAFLYNGSTKATGVQGGDVILALAPLVFGLLLRRVGRYVLIGR